MANYAIATKMITNTMAMMSITIRTLKSTPTREARTQQKRRRRRIRIRIRKKGAPGLQMYSNSMRKEEREARIKAKGMARPRSTGVRTKMHLLPTWSCAMVPRTGLLFPGSCASRGTSAQHHSAETVGSTTWIQKYATIPSPRRRLHGFLHCSPTPNTATIGRGLHGPSLKNVRACR